MSRRTRQAVTGEPESEESVDAVAGEGPELDEMQMTSAAAELLEAAAAAVMASSEDLIMEDSPGPDDSTLQAGPTAAAAADGVAAGSTDDGEQYSFGGMVDTDEGEGEDAEEEGDDDDDDESEDYGDALQALVAGLEDEVEDEEDEEDEEEEDGIEVNIGGARATLGRGGIMNLLFGHHRGLHSGHEVFRDMPRLPLPLQPMQGDLAASINRGTRGLDIGQADPVWSCLDSSCDSINLQITTTATQFLHQQAQSGFQRVHPGPEPSQGSNADVSNDNSSSSREVGLLQGAQQQWRPSGAEGGGRGEAGGRGVGSSLGGAIGSMVQAAAAAAAAVALPGGVAARTSARRRTAAAAAALAAEPAGDTSAAAAAAAEGAAAASSSSSSASFSGHRVINTACMVFKREVALGRQYGFSRTQQVHLKCRTMPVFPQKVRDHMHSRAYIGQYSGSGDFFIAAYQDRRVRLYDTTRNWALRKDITTRMTRWTITDTTMSPDQRLLVYASISPVAFVVNVGSSYDVVESQANITEVHEPLAFDGRYAEGADARRARRGAGSDSEDDWDGSIGIWSIAWSPQGAQLIAGTNGNAVYVYDIESKRCLTKLTNHQDDVNAVAYLRDGDPHLVVSGSDDHMVRVWDLRDRCGTLRSAQGVLVGHTEGITHVSPKGDGHHLISNCKDQTVKLWDTRRAVTPAQAAAAARNAPRIPRWDYRWEDYPATGYAVRHPDDVSLMTYRGHAVLQTLVRAYFSPAHSTGQRYIYAGNAEGDIIVWDIVSGKQVSKLQYHQSLVRDCSWHPYEPELTSVSWDGTIISWGVEPPSKPLRRHRG